MRTLFHNGYYLAPDMTVKSGEIVVNDTVIEYVGDKTDIVCDKTIDIHGGLLMPGFCDAHTHSPMTFLRSCADDMPLNKWLNEQIFPREAKLCGEDIYYLTKLAVMEYVSGGITSCFDMYFYPDDFVRAMLECGFRSVLCGAVNDFSESVEKLEDYYLRFNKIDPLISYKLGFHAEYTTSEEILKGIAALADKYKAPVYAHIAETSSEVQGCIERHGMTPAEYFDSLGLYNYGGGGFHCVYMSENDIEIYKRRKLSAVTNPCSNAKLASGIAPLSKLYDAGINVGIGTDGPASNNALDMFREMYLAAVMQKIKLEDAAAVPADVILNSALRGSAEAMGINAGILRSGALADIIVIDLDMPNMQPVNNIVKNLVYSGSRENVVLTMVNGKILYRDGEYYIGEEPQYIFRKANEIAKRINASV